MCRVADMKMAGEHDIRAAFGEGLDSFARASDDTLITACFGQMKGMVADENLEYASR